MVVRAISSQKFFENQKNPIKPKPSVSKVEDIQSGAATLGT